MITDDVPGDPGEDNNSSIPGLDEARSAGTADPLPDPVPAPPKPRNQHLRVEEPKNKQFTGRATETEAARINRALHARKQGSGAYDIVRLCLDMINHIEADFLQTFKTR